MTDSVDTHLNLGNIVFDQNNEERKSWKLLGHSCSRSLALFISQFVVILIVLACSIVRISLAKTCEESTVWVAILSSTLGYILPSPKL